MSSKLQALQFGSSSKVESNGDNSMAGLKQNDEAKSFVNTGGGAMVDGDVPVTACPWAFLLLCLLSTSANVLLLPDR